MTVIAPLSRYKRGNFKIVIVLLLGAAAWMAYDGYLNKDWIAKHTREDGRPDSDLTINRVAPLFLAPAGVALTVWFALVRGKRVVADDEGLVVGGRRIPYESIEAIDKTYFESKGYFVVTYRREGGGTAKIRLNDRKYDNLSAVLDELVQRIT